jgi:hypothetical protein
VPVRTREPALRLGSASLRASNPPAMSEREIAREPNGEPRTREGVYRLDREISSSTTREGSVAASHTHSAMSSGWSIAARISGEGG